MALDSLVFTYPHFTVTLRPTINVPERGCYLGGVPVDVAFPSGFKKSGYLVYDRGKGVFITALTDFLEKSIDWNDPATDQQFVRDCNTYRLEISKLFSQLYSAGHITESEQGRFA